jgi:hypothetical protein
MFVCHDSNSRDRQRQYPIERNLQPVLLNDWKSYEEKPTHQTCVSKAKTTDGQSGVSILPHRMVPS